MNLKWKANPDGSLTLPKGEYYIGDLCYVQKLSDVWSEFWNNSQLQGYV